jgi:hypothetical protein
MRNLERSIFLMSTRNDCTVGADTTASGSEFQMRTTRHAKKWFRMLHLASGISRRNEWPLKNKLVDGMNMSLIVIEEKPRTILKHKIKSERRRRCSSDCNLRWCKRSAYVSWSRPGSLLVNVRCTLSISLIRCMYDGDQTGDTYSTSGRTYVMNARLRWEVSRDRKPRKMSEDRWRARVTQSRMWWLNLSFESINTPRSLTWSTGSSVWLDME